MTKQKKFEAKNKLKKPNRTLEMGKKTARTKAAVNKIAKAETKTKASTAKPVVLKLPRTLKKAARACAKAKGLKLRAWIVESIKIQNAKESTSSATKPLQTA